MSEKIKAAALSASKGLSRVQAERAAENATRNVNAYGQKEEGPSRWQEKKEAKTQMYLKSTEKQATLNQKKCQKCQKIGHWTYECQKQAPEKENPKLDIRTLMSQNLDEKSDKGSKKKKKKKKKEEKGSKGRKNKRKSSSDSDSESDRDDDRSSRKKRKKHSRR